MINNQHSNICIGAELGWKNSRSHEKAIAFIPLKSATISAFLWIHTLKQEFCEITSQIALWTTLSLVNKDACCGQTYVQR